MSKKALTVRFDEHDDTALGIISKLLKTSKNQLIVNAVRMLIETQSTKLADDMESLSEKLRQYAKHDPNHDKAIDAFAKAEGQHKDPLEGKIVPADVSILDEVGDLLENA